MDVLVVVHGKGQRFEPGDNTTLGGNGSARQYRLPAIRYQPSKWPKLLNICAIARTVAGMKQFILYGAVVIGLALAGPASAADCFADYKAKQDNPLRLHYGVMQLGGPCARGPARSEVAARLARSGWTLLNVVSVFGPDGLAERRGSAGSYYLRF